MIDYVEAGKVFRAARQQKNLTQKQLAQLSGIDAKKIGKIEGGHMWGSPFDLLQVLKALGLVDQNARIGDFTIESLIKK